MVRRVFANIGLFPLKPGRISPKRHFSHSFSRCTALALPLHPDVRARDLVRAQKLAALVNYLSSKLPNPSRVWAYYVDVLTIADYRDVPLQVYQDVLRKCTESSDQVRVSQRLRNATRRPHMHEARFKAIFRNIRAAGWAATLDDYHFVLQQFAAAGHHAGAMNIFRELTRRGIEPRSKTFGLCLQAIAHRLTLPCPRHKKPALIAETRTHCSDLMNAMCTYKRPFISVNLDLAVRILKETMDEAGLDMLLKVGYAIDLSNPDRPYTPSLDKRTLPSAWTEAREDLPPSQPFSTSALNTTIDLLGRFGNVSKLVQAFEVLTQPLPAHSYRYFSS
jgi:hypothetical protein